MATPLLQLLTDPRKKGKVELQKQVGTSSKEEKSIQLDGLLESSFSNQDEYAQLQLRIFRTTLVVTAAAIAISAIFEGLSFSFSLSIGAFSGILYLRLLARNIGKLGKGTKSVGKIQLLIPVFLVILASRFSQLELLPALLGFLLYKPSLIVQILLES